MLQGQSSQVAGGSSAWQVHILMMAMQNRHGVWRRCRSALEPNRLQTMRRIAAHESPICFGTQTRYGQIMTGDCQQRRQLPAPHSATEMGPPQGQKNCLHHIPNSWLRTPEARSQPDRPSSSLTRTPSRSPPTPFSASSATCSELSS